MAVGTTIIIAVVIVIAAVIAIGYGSYLVYQRYLIKKKNERLKHEPLQIQRSSRIITASIRGNLVRTYTHPIETDYIIFPDQELGKGGVGVVYVGQKKDNNTNYAIKYVNKIAYEREVARLERELKLLKDVDHTNIVRLFSVYNLPEKMFFVMELCSGGHLGNMLTRQPQKRLSEEWARRLCLQLVSAVNHIHSKGICHRDIKLQNILMDHANDSTSQVKLIDFGYGAKFIGNLPMRTKCGTPYTTAPEVLRESYDERCDIWSIGVVLYIMLSGRRPFETLEIPGALKEAGRAAMISNILACRYHLNHATFRTVSDDAKEFVQQLLLPDYELRMTSSEVLEHPWLKNNDDNISEYNAHLMSISTSSKGSRAISNMKVTAFNTSKNLTMIPLVFSLNASQTAEMRTLFQSFDRDSSGSLSRDEYVKAMAVMSPDLNTWDVNHLFDIIDIDGDGTISYTEFLAATLDPRGIDLEQLNEAFNLMDAGGKGYITYSDIQRMLNVETDEVMMSHLPATYTQSQHLPSSQMTPTSRRHQPRGSTPSTHFMISQGSSHGYVGRPTRRSAGQGSGQVSRRASQSEREVSDRDGMGISSILKSPSRAAATAAAALGFTFGFGNDDDDRNLNQNSLNRESTINDNADVDGLNDDSVSYDPKATMARRIRDMMDLFDADNDGVISYDEFLWAMTGAGKLYGTELPETFISSKRRLPNNLTVNSSGKVKLGNFLAKSSQSSTTATNNSNLSGKVTNGSTSSIVEVPAKPILQSDAIVSYVSSSSSKEYIPLPTITTIMHDIETIEEINDSSSVVAQSVRGAARPISLPPSVRNSPKVEGTVKVLTGDLHLLDTDKTATLPQYRRDVDDHKSAASIKVAQDNNMEHVESVVDGGSSIPVSKPAQSIKPGVAEMTSSLLRGISGMFGITTSSSKASSKNNSLRSTGRGSSKVHVIGPNHRMDPPSPTHETGIAISDSTQIVNDDDHSDTSMLSKNPSWRGSAVAIKSLLDTESGSNLVHQLISGDKQYNADRKTSIVSGTLDELLAMTMEIDTSKQMNAQDDVILSKVNSPKSSKRLDHSPVVLPPRKYSNALKKDEALQLKMTSQNQVIDNNNSTASGGYRSSSQASSLPNPYSTTFISPISRTAQNVLKS